MFILQSKTEDWRVQFIVFEEQTTSFQNNKQTEEDKVSVQASVNEVLPVKLCISRCLLDECLRRLSP